MNSSKKQKKYTMKHRDYRHTRGDFSNWIISKQWYEVHNMNNNQKIELRNKMHVWLGYNMSDGTIVTFALPQKHSSKKIAQSAQEYLHIALKPNYNNNKDNDC